MITSHNVWSIHNADSSVELFQDQYPAARQGRSPRCGLNLEEGVHQTNRIVAVDRAFVLNREDAIQVQRAGWNKGCTGLSGRLREAGIELVQINVSQKRICRIDGRDVADTQFLRQASLPGSKIPFSSSSRLRRVSRDHLNAQLFHGPSNLRQLALIHELLFSRRKEKVPSAVAV